MSGSEREWKLGSELRAKIEHSGFKINDKKTRMQFRGSRQVTTGLMVNEKVNIRQEYWRAAREMCHALFTTGAYYKMVPAALMGGASGDPPVKKEFTNLNSIGGTLAHIHQVREHADRRKGSDKRKDPTAARTLYRQFLFYKNFVALEKPLIVPEGKTDSVYLRCAIRRLSAYHPRLGSLTEGSFQSKIRFMNFSATIHDVLELGHGAAQLNAFLGKYETCVREFGHSPLNFPVIVLVDNDDGGKSLFSLAGKKSKTEITYKTTNPFYYLGLNLYLVKTPEQAASPHTSFIENFFEPAVLNTVLDGKTFDPDKETDAPGKYGKAVFAARVVEPNADKINFSGFAPLLDRIVGVLDDHAKKKAAPLAAAV